MKVSSLFILSALCVSCGTDQTIDELLRGKDDGYESSCREKAADIDKEKEDLEKKNKSRREQAIIDEQTRLGVGTVEFFVSLLDNPDPFPNAVPIGKNSGDERKYAVFHGFSGNDTIYETAPGSRQYFIVDHAAGDGYGLNKVEQFFGAKHFVSKMAFHSWQSSQTNVLVRAEQLPQTEVIRTESICGCGPNSYEMSGPPTENDTIAMPSNPAVFLLPGTLEPTIGTEAFSATYINEVIELKYVPKKGKKCKDRYIVC
jgi:hypothetical protein